MKVKTPKFRVSFPKVFKAEVNKLSGKAEFSVVALFPKGADLSALEKAAESVKADRWGNDKAKWPKNLKSPFRDQGEKVRDDGSLPVAHEKGAVFMNFKSKEKPGVVDQNVQPVMEESEFYAGCWAIASVNAYSYDQAGNKGVSFGLNNLQKVKDDESFSGKPTPESDFSPVDAEPPF